MASPKRHERLLIGLGTGRCGTVSLATLLASQDGATIMHEANSDEFSFNGKWLPWAQGELANELSFERTGIAEFLSAMPVGEKFTGDVGFYYLPWVRAIAELWPNVRFICMERERNITVESLVWKAERGNRNPWMEHDGTRWRHHPGDIVHPKFDGATGVEDACGRYWDHYAARSRELAQLLPGRFAVVPIESLNEAEGVKWILDYCGFENPKIIGPLRLNSRASYGLDKEASCQPSN